MELQLGLSLSSSSTTTNSIIKLAGFDLNNQIYEPKDNFGSNYTDQYHGSDHCLEMSNKNKRRFDDQNTNSLSSSVVTQKTLPLLLWNDQPNEDEEDDDHMNRPTKKRTCSYTINNQVEEEVSSVVGWPPVKSWMKRKLHHHYHPDPNPNPHQLHLQLQQHDDDDDDDDHDHEQDGCVDDDHEDEDHRKEEENGSTNGTSNSMFVKVTMEGMGIGRKVDLSLHQSYQTLTTTLINMFGEYQKKGVKGLKEGTCYTLTYQDKEGDWLLVGDVPWQTFIGSVQRLKILRDGC